MEREEQDALEAAQHQHETELLQQDPAFLAWLESLNAKPEQEPEHENRTDA